MTVSTIIIILLVLLLIGALPNWSHMNNQATPAGIIVIILVVFLILKLLDKV